MLAPVPLLCMTVNTDPLEDAANRFPGYEEAHVSAKDDTVMMIDHAVFLLARPEPRRPFSLALSDSSCSIS